ncbi:MAG TPA: alpha/beta fold hydrolase, partial [Gemmatimonadaceae bacterium]|nr:alpha/beta fold hydrolase [Gemmatimonadaceae bacterium]
IALVLAASGAAATASPAQTPAERGAFVMVQRGDTVAIERFVRAPDSVAVDLVIKTQGRFVYVARTAKDFTISQLALSYYLPNNAADAPPAQTALLTLRGDSVIAEIGSGAQRQVQRIKTTAGAVMLPPSSFVAFEQLTMKERAAGGAISVPVFATSGGATAAVSLTPIGSDSVVASVASQEYRLKVDRVGRILGGAAAASGLSISRVDEAMAARLALGKPDYSAPVGAPYTAEEVSLPGPAGTRLGGTLTLPNSKSPVPAVVTITGSGQQDRDEYIPVAGGYRPFRQIADTLGRRGIAVLRLDDRGIGASNGNPATSTSADFADDIRAAVAYLRTRRDIDPSRIALVGHSEGAMIAPMVAANDRRLRGIVLLAGPSDNGREIIRYQQRYAIEHDTALTAAKRDSIYRLAQIQLDSMAARNPWIHFFLAYDPDTTAKKVSVPVLILQGANDQQVPAEQAEKLAAAIRAGGNKDVTVHVFPNRNHLFIVDPVGNPQEYSRLPTNKIDAEVLGVLSDWLAKKLK